MEILNGRVRLVWLANVLTLAAILGAIVAAVAWFGFQTYLWVAGGVFLALLVVGVAYVVRHYQLWQFEIRDDSLYLERGVITRVKTVVPYVRVQHVDSQRRPIERLLGLASVVVYTAGSRGADVTIPGLTPERADALQERLRELAVESEYEDAV